MLTKQKIVNDYDHVIVAFSGGKDSLACILHLLDLGIPEHMIELWHHDIDHGGASFFDWPVTTSYCKAVAKHLGIPIFFSWRCGGLRGEMLRENAVPDDIQFETPAGLETARTIKAEPGTRRKFPMVTNDMNRRWCTSYLKIDVGQKAVTHQARFYNSRVLFITGERAEESDNRATYPVFEFSARKSALIPRINRHVDAWRPVHGWSRADVWKAIERHAINPHPCYKLGWGRCSCACCVFSSRDQWASLYEVCPDKIRSIAAYERSFGKTMYSRKRPASQIGTKYIDVPIMAVVKAGTTFPGMRAADIADANSTSYGHRIGMTSWVKPVGATAGRNADLGPT